MDFISNLLGLDTEKLLAHHMACRAIIVFVIALIFVRISGIRMLGKHSSFDHLTVLMLGAMMGRAIVVSQPFEGTILAAFVLILLHRFVAWLTYKSKIAGHVLKGDPILLVKDNKEEDTNMRKTHITRHDIMEALRMELNTGDFEQLKDAYLERSGKISIIKK